MCVRCYYGGECRGYSTEGLRLITMDADISIKALVGGNWDIQADYWRSLIRAGLLEGRVYVVKNEQKIVSVGVWYEAGNDVFQTSEVSVLEVKIPS